MIESVGGSAASYQTQALKSPSRTASAVGETASAFDIALQIQDVQVANLKRTLEASTLVLDLLV